MVVEMYDGEERRVHARLRYAAFISYAHKDKHWASWLHRKLENYRVPKAAAHEHAGRRTLRPVFRDRDELTASSALGPALMDAIEGSGHLILLCSPASARSKWVNEEVRAYRKRHGAARVLPFIVDGEPGSGGDDDCLPPALLEPETPGGPPIEPICADARKHADGKRLAFLKLAAGMLGIGLDELVRRDQARRQRRMAIITGASMTASVATGALALYANDQRAEAVEQRQMAEANERRAEATVDFLVDTFAVANPATENARTITAFSILERSADRVETELANEPAVQVRLYQALGSIYKNLGLYDESDTMLFRGKKIAEPGSEAAAWLSLYSGLTMYHRGRLDEAEKTVSDTLHGIQDDWDKAAELRAWGNELLGLIHRDKLQIPQSLEFYTTAISLYIEMGPEYDTARARAIGVKGLVLAQDGRFTEAKAAYKEALKIYEREAGTKHIDYATTLNNLAFTQLQDGNAEAAIEGAKLALEILVSILDEEHPTLAQSRMNLGNSLYALERLPEAEEMYRSALNGLSSAYPEGHFETGFAHVYLAMSLSGQGQTEKALKHLQFAKKNYDIGYGQKHANHGDLEIHRAIVLHAAGRVKEAGNACIKGANILAETIGLDSVSAQGLLEKCAQRGLPITG
ncbi:toll/interleukin-1 receptor domain-containing protein [Pacificimonas sp. WHA3]|uniref:Toll/interleukin-1 receptor domain-containing protein n=1 Tax=Pacificimonas pallii TaxID=2827236 RepID=A0ABS6SCG9_9SPHN|nr:toll/interleukin-1 receptor domain-containing protein [Pacificimonas pallii]MBV7256109.1 toll/interleukin-1 receptor domain-containing protein [Pacificimonas pallii]